jgi:hypothetical protein
VSFVRSSDPVLTLETRAAPLEERKNYWAICKRFNVVHLELQKLPKTPSEYNFWNQVSELQQLFSMNIDPDGDQYDDRLLAPLAKLPNLNVLKIGKFCHLNSTPMPNLSHLTQIRNLQLGCITDVAIEFFSSLSLNSLTLSNSNITEKGFANLCKITTLQHLEMESTGLNGNFAKISNLQNLNDFHKSDGELNSESMKALAACPLKFLNLDCAQMTGEEIRMIFDMKQLIFLVLSRFNVNDASLEGIQNLANLQCLCLLNAENITGAILEKIGNLTGLDHLSLRNCPKLETGYLHLEKLKNLKVLDIKRSNLPLEAYEVISKLPSLTDLDVSNCQYFDDQALETLAQHCPQLQKLTLCGTSITHQGLKHLLKFQQLHTLNLGTLFLNDFKEISPLMTSLQKATFHVKF